MTVIAAPAARSEKYAAALTHREAARRRATIAYRYSQGREMGEDAVQTYQELGFDVDGYPIGYSGPKTLA